MATISRKRQKFIEEYLRCWNAAEAARRAGYSERTARKQGSRLLTIADIQEEIQRRINETVMSADEVLTRLAEQARGVYGDYIQAQYGTAHVNLEQLVADGKGHLIKALRYGPDGGLRSVEFYDAQAALVQLGRHHALFTDRVAVQDWRDRAVELIRDQEVTYEAMEQEFGSSLAEELFRRAGVPVSES